MNRKTRENLQGKFYVDLKALWVEQHEGKAV
jgi:hypothetical protein